MMNNNSWFKKEKPLLSLQSMGGGAAGLMISAGEPDPIAATGGTKSYPGDGYIYHVFTSSGSLVVTQGEGAEFNALLVGGGGGGGFDRGGGGGGGGLYNGTELKMGAAATYPVTVGSGGAGNPQDPVPGGDWPKARGNNGGSSGMPTLVPAGGVAGGGGGGGAASNPDGSAYDGRGRTSASGGGALNQHGEGGLATNPNTGAGPYGSPGHGSQQGAPWGDTGGGGGGAGGQLNTGRESDPGAPSVPTDAPPLQLGSYGGWGKEIPWVPGLVAGSLSPTGTAYFAGGGFGGGSAAAAYPPGSTAPTMDYRWAGSGQGGHIPGYGGDAVGGTGSGGGGGGQSPVGSRVGGDGAPGVVVVRYEETKNMEATGGTIVDSGGYRSHFFTSPGTFAVTVGTQGVQYLVLGGGGSGGGKAPNGVVASGGGGAGGLISSFPEGPGGPNPPATSGEEVSPTGGPTSNGQYAVVVGPGGAAGPTSPDPTWGKNGQLSSLTFSPTFTVSATGGGEGGIYQGNPHNGNPGGSGGGGGYSEDVPQTKPGGDGTAGMGYPGGFGRTGAEGGGGGAGGAGTPANPGPSAPVNGGAGGDGKGFANIPPSYGTPGPSPTLRYFAGGGGGGAEATRTPSTAGAGGYGGGGAGAQRDPTGTVAGSGTANTGGGGGGGQNLNQGPTIGSGGSGIVIIRYAYSS